MPEDKATLRSGLSADMKVSGKGDTVALIFFLVATEYYPFWKPKSDKPDQNYLHISNGKRIRILVRSN